MSLILDVVVLVLLGLTIVYAARLSLQLRRLRDSKSDLDRVVRELIKNLDRADRAITGLKEAARDSGTDLQDAIDKAMSISDELQLITESGDRLATRLESLMDTARPLAGQGTASAAAPRKADLPKSEPAPPADHAPGTASYAQHLRKLDAAPERTTPERSTKTSASRGGGPSFAIRDPEVERGMDPLADKVGMSDDGSGEGLYSEAERDLFRAMKGRAAR